MNDILQLSVEEEAKIGQRSGSNGVIEHLKDLLSRATRQYGTARHNLKVAVARSTVLEVMGGKVNAIRNSIVGMQGFNFSEHAYPLVAALEEAGFKGVSYEMAAKNLGTLIEQRDASEKKLKRVLEQLPELDRLERFSHEMRDKTYGARKGLGDGERASLQHAQIIAELLKEQP